MKTRVKRERRPSPALRQVGVAACALASLFATRAATTFAQSTKMEKVVVVCPVVQEQPQPLGMGRAVVGSSACFACHLQGTASFLTVDKEITKVIGAEFIEQAKHDNWVLGNEWTTWATRDRHPQAYTSLLGKRGREMGRLMGIAEVNRDARCLACHSSLPMASVEREGYTVAASYFRPDHVDERISLGVNCEACHGAAGVNSQANLPGWINDHVASQTWRYKATADKEAEFGFYDVRSPGSRARMCLSCHLGSAAEGRVVTHEMYAAGHPPLPGFEVEAFSAMMPAHWRELGGEDSPEANATNPALLVGKKPKGITAEFLANTGDVFYRNLEKNYPDYYKAILDDYSLSCDQTRSLAVGALVAWAASAQLTAALASEAEHPLVGGADHWPELSQFECFACHHDLRTPGWRQDRRTPTPPGRPLIKEGSPALARAVLAALAPNKLEVFDAERAKLEQAATAAPYGDRQALEAAATAAAAWMDQIAAEIEARPFTRGDALTLLREIAAAGAGGLLEYDDARQLAWAAKIVLHEIGENSALARAQAELTSLESNFALDLATVNNELRDDEELSVPGFGKRTAHIVKLAATLPRAAEYDASDVREAFGKLAAAVKKAP